MQRNTITLEHPTDWQGFRTAARALVQADVPPQAVDWRCQADAAEDLFAPEAARHNALPPPAPDAPTLRVPLQRRANHVGICLERGQIRRRHLRFLLERLRASDVLDLDEPLLAVVEHNSEIRRAAADCGMDPTHILGLEQSKVTKAKHRRFK